MMHRHGNRHDLFSILFYDLPNVIFTISKGKAPGVRYRGEMYPGNSGKWITFSPDTAGVNPILLNEFSEEQLLLGQGERPAKALVLKEGIVKCYFDEAGDKGFIVEFSGNERDENFRSKGLVPE